MSGPCLLSLSSDNEIVCFLKVQLAEAINLQDKNQMAQIQETTRCVSHLDPRTCRKLLTAMAEDYRYTHYSLSVPPTFGLTWYVYMDTSNLIISLKLNKRIWWLRCLREFLEYYFHVPVLQYIDGLIHHYVSMQRHLTFAPKFHISIYSLSSLLYYNTVQFSFSFYEASSAATYLA